MKIKTISEMSYRRPYRPIKEGAKILYGTGVDLVPFDLVRIVKNVIVDVDGEVYTGYVLMCLERTK